VGAELSELDPNEFGWSEEDWVQWMTGVVIRELLDSQDAS
jgi:hypothetical protein